MWRNMKEQDLKKVHSLSLTQWGTSLYEAIEIYQNKLEFCPEGCFVYEKDNKVKGYFISHKWNSNQIPELNKVLPFIRETEYNCYFIHDIVLEPELRRQGIGSEIINKIIEMDIPISLVAQVPTQYYWIKYFNFEKSKIKCNYGIHLVR
jgi:GNAT superfamily N-acetyltransferase